MNHNGQMLDQHSMAESLDAGLTTYQACCSCHPAKPLLLLLVVVLSGCLPFKAPEANALTMHLPHQLAPIKTLNLKEPSGIVFHAPRGTLFVVGDEGDLAELEQDGHLLKASKIGEADFEGITYNPATGLLYAINEKEGQILELDPDDFRVVRKISIDPLFNGKDIFFTGKHGAEAITFVPDSGHPEGGTFFVTCPSQKGSAGKLANSTILEITAPLLNLSATEQKASITSMLQIPVGDLSGLDYDPVTTNLYLVSDYSNTFLEIDHQGQVLKAYTLPGENQEGIALDADGFIYLVQDSGGIIKLKWLKESP